MLVMPGTAIGALVYRLELKSNETIFNFHIHFY